MNQKRNQIVVTDLKTCYLPRLLISPAKGGVRARQGAQKRLKRGNIKPLHLVETQVIS